MLYHLFQYLDRSYDLPGAGMFQYISFRSALAVILALLITITFGQGIIRFMQRRQIGEEIRNLGLEGQLQKRGTPTMGGVMILLAVLVPVLLFGRLDNIYIQLMIVSTVWLGLLGFLDDYIKVFRHNKEGLKGKFKIVGQVGIGIIVGTVMCASPEVVVRDKVVEPVQQLFVDDDGEVIESVTTNRVVMGTESVKTTQTTIPFVKNNEFDYAWFTGGNRVATWILYVLVAIFVVTAVSNGANLTDGLDGLVSGVSAPIVVVLAILVPILLFGRLDNIYIQLMIVSTVWLGLIGGLDDYIKVFRHNKEGLKGRFKIVGQVGLGIIVGTTMWLSPQIIVREKVTQPVQTVYLNPDGSVIESVQRNVVLSSESTKTTKTTIPFVKNNEFDYGWLTGEDSATTWLLYVLVAIFVVTAVSNGANLTDGLDGLATGVSVPIVAVLGVLAYLSGHIVYADYLNIMYIPDSGELVVFAAAFAGALVGFLWYNSFPAQIFMGDTGSLSIGGIIAVFALCIRKELLLPLLCGVFLVESFSVMMQVGYFKYTKRKYGEGQRLLLMAPVHHHFQKKGQFETKIVLRFWIISLLLAAITLVTLKIR